MEIFDEVKQYNYQICMMHSLSRFYERNFTKLLFTTPVHNRAILYLVVVNIYDISIYIFCDLIRIEGGQG